LVLVVIAGELIPVLTDQVLCNRQASPPRSPRGPRALSQREPHAGRSRPDCQAVV